MKFYMGTGCLRLVFERKSKKPPLMEGHQYSLVDFPNRRTPCTVCGWRHDPEKPDVCLGPVY